MIEKKEDIKPYKFYKVSEIAATSLISRAKTFANRRRSIYQAIQGGTLKAKRVRVKVSPTGYEEEQYVIRGSDLLKYIAKRYGTGNESDR